MLTSEEQNGANGWKKGRGGTQSIFCRFPSPLWFFLKPGSILKAKLGVWFQEGSGRPGVSCEWLAQSTLPGWVVVPWLGGCSGLELLCRTEATQPPWKKGSFEPSDTNVHLLFLQYHYQRLTFLDYKPFFLHYSIKTKEKNEKISFSQRGTPSIQLIFNTFHLRKNRPQKHHRKITEYVPEIQKSFLFAVGIMTNFLHIAGNPTALKTFGFQKSDTRNTRHILGAEAI